MTSRNADQTVGVEGNPVPVGAGLADYSGQFIADFQYEALSREALVRLVREYAQAVDILDRSMGAAIGMSHGMQEMERLAIEEWRGQAPSTATAFARSWVSRATM